MKPVLVLGASGFVGRAVCATMSGASPAVPWVGVCRRPPGRDGRWVSLDVAAAPPGELAALVERILPTAVVNCVGASAGSAAHLRSANVDLVRSLLAAVARIPGTRLVHMGSAAEYGRQPTDGPVAETAVPHPEGPYARSKLVGTELVVSALDGRAGSGVVLRLFNPVGAGAPEWSLAGAAARAIADAIARDRRWVALGDLGARRDFVAAEDVGRAVVLALRAPALPPVLNVGRGAATSAAALVALVEEAAGFTGTVLERDGPRGQSPSLASQRADVSLLRRTLGWAPSTSLAAAVEALWSDLVAQRGGELPPRGDPQLAVSGGQVALDRLGAEDEGGGDGGVGGPLGRHGGDAALGRRQRLPPGHGHPPGTAPAGPQVPRGLLHEPVRPAQ